MKYCFPNIYFLLDSHNIVVNRKLRVLYHYISEIQLQKINFEEVGSLPLVKMAKKDAIRFVGSFTVSFFFTLFQFLFPFFCSCPFDSRSFSLTVFLSVTWSNINRMLRFFPLSSSFNVSGWNILFLIVESRLFHLFIPSDPLTSLHTVRYFTSSFPSQLIHRRIWNSFSLKKCKLAFILYSALETIENSLWKRQDINKGNKF